MKKFYLLSIIVTCNIIANAQPAIDTFLQNYMFTHHIPGMSACIIKNGKVAWAKAYGLADIANNKPVTTNTIFMIESVSKIITADALMNVWENGTFNLNDSINSVLPWNVHNPWFPNVPITFSQLLTHTSSIRDSWHLYNYQVLGDSPYSQYNA